MSNSVLVDPHCYLLLKEANSFNVSMPYLKTPDALLLNLPNSLDLTNYLCFIYFLKLTHS